MRFLTRQLSVNDPWPSHDFSGHSVGIVGDYAWSTEAIEWNVCCVVSYSTVSCKLWVPDQFYYDLY